MDATLPPCAASTTWWAAIGAAHSGPGLTSDVQGCVLGFDTFIFYKTPAPPPEPKLFASEIAPRAAARECPSRETLTLIPGDADLVSEQRLHKNRQVAHAPPVT